MTGWGNPRTVHLHYPFPSLLPSQPGRWRRAGLNRNYHFHYYYYYYYYYYYFNFFFSFHPASPGCHCSLLRSLRYLTYSYSGVIPPHTQHTHQNSRITTTDRRFHAS
ncbi:unnamed protein product [Tuber aestivum]|uniref:Uncharacterized protein n=1 Tax=Tuber aestivum TaxID=59557 RepID=A0A292Q4S7_9PEZI|nr:unnamed protein product [Tuber aestivum]